MLKRSNWSLLSQTRRRKEITQVNYLVWFLGLLCVCAFALNFMFLVISIFPSGFYPYISLYCHGFGPVINRAKILLDNLQLAKCHLYVA